MEIVRGAQDQLGVRQLNTVVGHRNDGARAARYRPGGAQVEIETVAVLP